VGKGSHRICHNLATDLVASIPDWGSKDSASGTVRAVIRELGITRREFGPVKQDVAKQETLLLCIGYRVAHPRYPPRLRQKAHSSRVLFFVAVRSDSLAADSAEKGPRRDCEIGDQPN
jgi:hypothetical protein